MEVAVGVVLGAAVAMGRVVALDVWGALLPGQGACVFAPSVDIVSRILQDNPARADNVLSARRG